MSNVATEAVIVPEELALDAVSWPAIAAGAVVSAAFTLFLVHLVTGLGLVSVSPWSGSGASGSTIHIAGGIALILTAVMASALAGYLAARLRTRWVGLHTDEVYFRDSAHGVIAWAFATVFTATVLAAAAGSFATSAVQGASSNPALVTDRNGYLVDTLVPQRPPGERRGSAGGASRERRGLAHPCPRLRSLSRRTARALRNSCPRAPACRRRKPNSASTMRSHRPRPRPTKRAKRPRSWRSGLRRRCSRVRSRPVSQRSKVAGCATTSTDADSRRLRKKKPRWKPPGLF